MESSADLYTIQVHIIEARRVKNVEDKSTRTISPICYVELFDERDPQFKIEKTEVVNEMSDVVWDKIIVWRGVELRPDQLASSLISFRVFDAGSFFRNTLLGYTTLNLGRAYSNTHNELWKQWLPLQLPEQYDTDFRGFLKFSLTITRGNEAPFAHTEDEDEEGDGEEDNIMAMLLDAPKIPTVFTVLRAKIYAVEHLKLPSTFGRARPYIQLRFGSNPPLKTRDLVATRRGRIVDDCRILDELQVPVSIPTLADTIHLEVFDAVSGPRSDNFIAKTFFSFHEVQFMHDIETSSAGLGPLWVPLYREEQHNDATEYVGRMLVALEAPFSETREQSRIQVNSLPDMPAADWLKEETFVMRFDLLAGAEFPQDMLTQSIEIEICMGPMTWRSRRLRTEHGEVKWYDRMENMQIRLPTNHPRSFPKIVVNVYSMVSILSPVRLGYIVYTYDMVKKELHTSFGEVEPEGFNHVAKWRALTPDRVNATTLDDESVPGFLLYKLDFGRKSDMPSAPQPRLEPPKQRLYQLRAHVYQARNLPVAEDNGSSNPFCTVRCGHATANTEVRDMTLHPLWYQTIRLDHVQLPTVLTQAPDITVLVNHRRPGRIRSGDVLLGRVRYPVHRVSKQQQEPEWIQLEHRDGNIGELLVSFQLIPMEEATRFEFPSIWPEFKDCILEIDAVGARGLKPFGVLNRLEGKNCYIAMDCGGGDTFYVHSKAQLIDSDCGSNYFERLRLPVKFPLTDPFKFSPHLTLRVFASDGATAPKRIRRDTLIGFASVPMLYNIPWANAGRRPRINKPTHALTIANAEEQMPEGIEDSVAAALAEEEAEKSGALNPDEIPIDMNLVNEMHETEFGKLSFSTVKSGPLSAGERTLGEAKETAAKEEEGDSTEVGQPKRIQRSRKDAPLELDKDFTSLFDDFPLKRGKNRNFTLWEKITKGKGKHMIDCGLFRGSFLTIEEDALIEDIPRVPLDEICRAKPYFVRVYVLGAEALARGSGGGSGPAPYLKIDMGSKTVFSEKSMPQRVYNHSSAPQFYQSAEAPIALPGTGQLTVSVFDRKIFRDELIGSAVVDLEARLFSETWRGIETKPHERFTLFNPSCPQAQGWIWMWIEILTPEQRARTPMEKLEREDPQPFELRCIVWNTKDVIPLDYSLFEDDQAPTTDIRVSGQYNQLERQFTDTHRNSSSGEGWFNWRMIWPINLPVPESEKPYYRMHLGVWNSNYLRPNDVICEGQINLQPWLMKARHLHKTLTLPKQWVKLYHPNFGDQVRGMAEITLEVMTVEDSERKKAGRGREEPNQHPKLETPDRPNQGFFSGNNFFAALRRKVVLGYLKSFWKRGLGCCGIILAIVLVIVILKIVGVF